MKLGNRLTRTLVVLALTAGMGAAQAQLSPQLGIQLDIGQALRGEAAPIAPAQGRETASATAIGPIADDETPGIDLLLQSYAPEQRDAARQSMIDMLDTFAITAEKLDTPARDIASGIAALIAGGHSAYTNTEFHGPYFKPLAAQVQQALATNPDVANLSRTDKIALYQVLTVSGMFLQMMQLELQKQPDPTAVANLRDMAQTTVRDALGLDLATMSFGPDGVTIR